MKGSLKCLLALNLLILCFANPVTYKPGPYIYGGNETAIEKNPWQVSLQIYGRHGCGGSIIGNHWVLTAAHCTEGVLPHKLAVRVGSTEHKQGGSIIVVKKIFTHPKYSSRTMSFDLSLLELTEPLTFTDQVQSVHLPNADTIIPDGKYCNVSGCGYTEHQSISNERLRVVEVQVINQERCQQQYDELGEDIIIEPNMICAGTEEGGKDSCQNDSGGPLTTIMNDDKTILVGVVSWGEGCGSADYPGVYARTTSARIWIQSVTGI